MGEGKEFKMFNQKKWSQDVSGRSSQAIYPNLRWKRSKSGGEKHVTVFMSNHVLMQQLSL